MRSRSVLVVVVCALALAGCSADADEPAQVTTAPTVEPTPTPTPSPTEKVATDLSDPEGVGIVFVETPDLSGPAASAHDAVAIYQKEFWRSQTTGTMSPVLAPLVSPTLLSDLEHAVQRNADSGWHVAGVLRVRISGVLVQDATATALACVDYSDVEFTKDDGAPQAWDQIGFQQYEHLGVSLSSSDEGVRWRIESRAGGEAPC